MMAKVNTNASRQCLILCGASQGGANSLLNRLHSACKPPQVEAPLDNGAGSGKSLEVRLDDHLDGVEPGQSLVNLGKSGIDVIVASGDDQNLHKLLLLAPRAHLAILTVDASEGMQHHTRLLAYLLNLCRVRNVLVVIDRMDLVDYPESAFLKVRAAFQQYAATLDNIAPRYIPTSEKGCENICAPGKSMPWHDDIPLMRHLEALTECKEHQHDAPFRLPIEAIDHTKLNKRSVFGTIACGRIAVGARIRTQPSGRESRVIQIESKQQALRIATAGTAVALTLEDEFDVLCDDWISAAEAPMQLADQFAVTIIWTNSAPLLPGRSYLLTIGCQSAVASVTSIKHLVNVDTHEHITGRKLELNSIGKCHLAVDRFIAFDPYCDSPSTGMFSLADLEGRHTVGVGLIDFSLRRSQNICLQHVDINKQARSKLKNQKSCVLWFTGLSGAGKSSIANMVEKQLHALGHHTYLLDGDNIRHGLNKDLGFTEVDRVENIRRIAEVSRLMVDAGLIVLTAFISPFRADRLMARRLVDPDEFIEIFVDVPLAVAEARDVKGLYKKARSGVLKNFTGIDSPYEPPEQPELRIDTSRTSLEVAAEAVLQLLKDKGFIRGVVEPGIPA